MKQFEDLTIGQLKQLHEQYIKLERENKLLKIKYPLKAKKLKGNTAEQIVEGLE